MTLPSTYSTKLMETQSEQQQQRKKTVNIVIELYVDRGWYACMNALTYRVLTTVKVRLNYFRKDTVMASLDRASEFHFDESETPTKCVVKCCHFPFVFRIKSKIIGHETHGAGTQIFLCTQLRNKSYQLTIYISRFFLRFFFLVFCSIEAKKNACTRTRICMLLNIMLL